MQENKRK